MLGIGSNGYILKGRTGPFGEDKPFEEVGDTSAENPGGLDDGGVDTRGLGPAGSSAVCAGDVSVLLGTPLPSPPPGRSRDTTLKPTGGPSSGSLSDDTEDARSNLLSTSDALLGTGLPALADKSSADSIRAAAIVYSLVCFSVDKRVFRPQIPARIEIKA